MQTLESDYLSAGTVQDSNLVITAIADVRAYSGSRPSVGTSWFQNTLVSSGVSFAIKDVEYFFALQLALFKMVVKISNGAAGLSESFNPMDMIVEISQNL